MEEEGKGEDRWGQQGSHGQEAERRKTHRTAEDRQGGARRQLRGPRRGNLGSSWGPVSLPQDRAELSGSSPPGLRGLAGSLWLAKEELQREKEPEQIWV